MTMQSLHSIVKIENELHAKEKAEQDRAAQWLREQEKEILAEHQARFDAMSGSQEEILEKTRVEAERNAADVVAQARKMAGCLDRLDNETLSACIDKHLVAILTGTIP